MGFTIATILNIANHPFGLLPLLSEILIGVVWALTAWLVSQRLPMEKRHYLRAKLLRFMAAVGGGAIATLVVTRPLWGVIASFLRASEPGGVPPFRFTGAFLSELFGLVGAGTGWQGWLLALLFTMGIGTGVYRRQWFSLAAIAWLCLPLGLLWLAKPAQVVSSRDLLFLQPAYLLMTGVTR